MDQKPRYVPEQLMTIYGMSKVGPIVAYPPGNARPKDCLIVKTMTAVACHLENGRVRWYGFHNAHINSELRMVVQGFDERFEEVSKWEFCYEV